MAAVAANSQSAGAGPLIRRNVLDDEKRSTFKNFLVLVVAVGISIILHAGIIGAMFLAPGPSSGSEAPLETIIKDQKKDEANVQPEPPQQQINEQPLSVQDVDPAALDPEMDLGYKVE